MKTDRGWTVWAVPFNKTCRFSEGSNPGNHMAGYQRMQYQRLDPKTPRRFGYICCRAFVLFLAILICLPALAAAKIILLKDGTRVEAENIQEEDGLIRFSLPGYEGIFITYSKDIVDGIFDEDQLPAEPASKASTEDTAAVDESEPGFAAAADESEPVPPDATVGADNSRQTSPELAATPRPQPEVAAAPETALSASVGEYTDYSGIEFYNPRRRFKYWTGPDEKHRRFEEAVEVLAERFGRSPEWVIANLGDANDLALIHLHLAERLQDKSSEEVAPPPNTIGVAFYDPRREYKYWSGPDRKHRSLEEAVESLAEQYNRPAEWIRAHLGASNDLAEVHRNLATAATAD
jgi:hypothetical protein